MEKCIAGLIKRLGPDLNDKPDMEQTKRSFAFLVSPDPEKKKMDPELYFAIPTS